MSSKITLDDVAVFLGASDIPPEIDYRISEVCPLAIKGAVAVVYFYAEELDEEAQKTVYDLTDTGNDLIDIGNNCTHCGEDTSFGSGRFVNRIPSTTDTQEGYMCPDCLAVGCAGCGEKTLEYLITEGEVFCLTCQGLGGI